LSAAPEGGDLADLSGAGAAVEDNSPAWSPDGAWLAFTRKAAGASMGRQVWLMRADGREARALTNTPDIHHALPQWSPDGQRLVYQQFPLKMPNPVPSLWLLDVTSGERREVVASGSRPAWLP
jgi:TolB protein